MSAHEPFTADDLAWLRKRFGNVPTETGHPETGTLEGSIARLVATLDAREVAGVSIVSTPDTMFGQARFDGTRIPLRIPLSLLAAGESVESINRMYPTLPEGWYEVVLALKGLLRSKYRNAIR